MDKWPRIDRSNNFDLIRLLAAVQVAVLHSTAHLDAALPDPVAALLRLFPGVPIFFFISGLLVTSSVVRPPLRQYAEARIRRIFPALLAAFALTLAVLVAFRQIGPSELADPAFWAWAASQVTVFQVFNPDMFRDFGVGVVNGSLWTIPIEIGFYILLPVMLWLARGERRALTLLMAASGAVSFLAFHLIGHSKESALLKLIWTTPIVHFWLFALGSLAYIHLGRVMTVVNQLRRLPAGWALPVIVYIVFARLVGSGLPPFIAEAFGAFLLVASIFALGLIAPHVSGILRGNDISYGLYLSHMLFVNMAVALGYAGAGAVAIALAISIAVAFLSWRTLESPILRGKKRIAKPAAHVAIPVR